MTATYPPDSMFYRLAFVHPNGDMVLSGECKADASAEEFRKCVSNYYNDKFGSSIWVQKHTVDENNTVTTDSALIMKTRYTIGLNRLIYASAGSHTLIQFLPINTTSTAASVSFDYPPAVQISAPPLNGKYKIRCRTPSGGISYTNGIEHNSKAATI
jgi:hypothetical protein